MVEPGDIVQYMHQSQVPSEMNLFVGVSGFPLFFITSEICSQKYLEGKDAYLFAMAARINTMFGRNHPFTVSACEGDTNVIMICHFPRY